MINDAHCHFFSDQFFASLGQQRPAGSQQSAADVVATLGWEAPGSADALADRWVAELDRNGVRRAALIASVPGDEAAVAAAVRRHPRRFVGFFALNAAAPGAADTAARAFSELGLRCACLFPAMHGYAFDDPRVAAVFDAAAAHGGAIFGHCGYLSIEARTRLGLTSAFDLRRGDPLALAATAARFPAVPVIVPHFGAGFFREALMAAEACATIHFDTSSSNGWIKYFPGLTLTDVFHRALAIVGAERILFGTDSSFFPRGWRRVIHGAQEAILGELGVEPGVVEAIFERNFERLFHA